MIRKRVDEKCGVNCNISFEEIYMIYYNGLYRFAYHYIMNEDAEDIVQDIFTKVYENMDKLLDEDKIKSYLYSATKNSCLNYLRKLKIIDGNKDKLIETIFHYSNEYLDDGEAVDLEMQSCISKLPEQQKIILKLKIEGRSYKEISEILNISQGTVNTHVNRAYKYIKDNFAFVFLFIYGFIKLMVLNLI